MGVAARAVKVGPAAVARAGRWVLPVLKVQCGFRLCRLGSWSNHLHVCALCLGPVLWPYRTTYTHHYIHSSLHTLIFPAFPFFVLCAWAPYFGHTPLLLILPASGFGLFLTDLHTLTAPRLLSSTWCLLSFSVFRHAFCRATISSRTLHASRPQRPPRPGPLSQRMPQHPTHLSAQALPQQPQQPALRVTLRPLALPLACKQPQLLLLQSCSRGSQTWRRWLLSGRTGLSSRSSI